jgi:hypothetical protein
MKWAPRIRLQTIFLLIFCAAVGLAANNASFSGLNSTILTAMVIGLVQQAHQLAKWHPSDQSTGGELSPARRYAIVWRICMASMMAALLIFEMLLSQNRIVLRENRQFDFVPLTEGLPLICMLVVLCNSLVRWRYSLTPKPHASIRAPILWAIAVVITFFMLVQGRAIEFLIHRAFANTEARFSTQIRRPGVYIQLSDEDYRTLWLVFAAVVCLCAAGAVIAHRPRAVVSTKGKSFSKSILVLVLVLPAAIFSFWYYSRGYHRISPEMAGAGLASGWSDWVAGACIAIVVVTAGAYRVARTDSPSAVICRDLAHDIELHSLHESVPILACLGIDAGVSLATLSKELIMYTPFRGSPTVGGYLSILYSPTNLLMIAGVLATLQLCWIRWRNRSRTVAWEITGLSAKSFAASWMSLALLVVVGIPTLHAFAFILWLGPYNLFPLLGL